MAAIKSNDSLLSFEMKLIANGKTSAYFVTPQSLSGDFIALNTPKQDSIMLMRQYVHQYPIEAVYIPLEDIRAVRLKSAFLLRG